MSNIILPTSAIPDAQALRIEKRLKQHDENLSVKFNQMTKEWCVYVKERGSDYEEVPVMGLGYELPSDDWVMNKMYEMDTWGYAKRLLPKIREHNQRLRDSHEKYMKDVDKETADKVRFLLAHPGRTV